MRPIKTVHEINGAFSGVECSEPDRYAYTVRPENGQTVTLKQLSLTFAFDFREDDFFFANGYQSWTYCPERSVKTPYTKGMRICPPALERKFGFTRYGDRHFSKVEQRKGLARGYSYAYVHRENEWFLFASLAEKSGFTRILLDTATGTVTFEKDCEGRETAADYPAFDILFLKGSENEVFDEWFRRLGVKPLTTEKVVGYTSWYNCYQNISKDRILSDLEGMRDLPVKPDIFQVDDGYETFVGDWLDVDPVKFPEGSAPIARAISAEGYTPGIWLAPFVCEKKSKLFREHPDWLLRDRKGKPVFCGGNWSGAYALDLTKDEVRRYIRDCIAHYIDEGFRLFKLDFLYAACMLGRKDMTRGEQMEDAMNFLRECCRDCAVIGCGVPLVSAFGKVEYCRVGPDVSLSFDDAAYMRLFHEERPSTRHTVLNTAFRRQLSGRAFLNDPDVFILREENTTLTADQKEMLYTVNGLFGGVLFASDEFERYSDAQKALFGKVCRLTQAKDVKVRRENGGKTLYVSYTLDNQTVEKRFKT